MPEFTAGGKRLAEIATPTREAVLLPSMDKATPIPLGIAMQMPVTRPIGSPRDNISFVGQSSAPLLNDDVKPMAPPIATERSNATASFIDEDLASAQSFTLAPNVYVRRVIMMKEKKRRY